MESARALLLKDLERGGCEDVYMLVARWPHLATGGGERKIEGGSAVQMGRSFVSQGNRQAGAKGSRESFEMGTGRERDREQRGGARPAKGQGGPGGLLLI